MKNIRTFFTMYGQLLRILDKKQKIKGMILIVLLIGVSLLETLGISVVIPFIIAMLDPETLLKNRYVKSVTVFLQISDYKNILFLVTLCIIGVYVVKNALILLVNYYQADYRNTLEKDLSIKMLSSYMKRPYAFFLDVNSADILRDIINDITNVAIVLDSYSGLFAEGLTCLFIGIFLISMNPFLAFSLLAITALAAIGIVLCFKKKTGECGEKTREAFSERYQCVYQTVTGVKEITVMQRRENFVRQFAQASEKACRYNTSYLCIQKAPNRLIETVFIGSMLLLVCVNVKGGNVSVDYISSLGTMAVAAVRILPSISNLTNSMNSLVFSRIALDEAYQNITAAGWKNEGNEIIQETGVSQIADQRILAFNEGISIEHIKWQYQENLPWVIDDLSLRIRKGEAVAFIGESGAGKTTLSDIILGLLHPQAGSVKVDNTDIFDVLPQWAKIVGYVPQSVFLLDDTIRNNIAFGLSEGEIDDRMIWRALEQAQIKTMVENLEKGLDTVVGERGIKFSGGQRQRIAIARALYYNPDILVLDEATSALDSETEEAVMEAIDALQGIKTIIIVAHRLTTIQKCDKIYEIKNGKAYFIDKNEIFND